MNPARWGLVWGIAAVLFVWAVCATVLLVVTRLDGGPSDMRAFTRLTVGIFVLAAVQGAILLASLVAVAVYDRRTQRSVSVLLWPIAVEAGFMLAITSLAGVNGLYLLHTDFERPFAPTQAPAFRLFGNVLYLGIFGAIGWLLALLLRGRGWPLWRLVLVFGAISVVGTLLIVGAVWQ